MTSAEPRTRGELSELPLDPQVVEAASRRGVTEVLHFTRVQQGALGILAARMISTRLALPADKLVQHVYEPNAVNNQRDRDRSWHDYVNLSITRINPRMFQYSRRAHNHPDTTWCVLSFSVDVLAAPGGVFTTTNNTYSGVLRSEGAAGFEALFAPEIHLYNEERTSRTAAHSASEPTDLQAEFLHLGDLPLTHLQRISTQTEEGCDSIHGMLGVLPTPCEVVHAPEIFS